MIDQSRVTSGFDVELVMGEEFIRYFLLCSLDTGSIPLFSESRGIKDDGTPFHDVTITHPPAELQDRRLYPVHPEYLGNEHPFQHLAPVYSAQTDEFAVTILPGGAEGDISLRVFPSIFDLIQDPPTGISNVLHIDLKISFQVVSTTRADGLLGDIGVQLTLLDASGPLIDAAVALGRKKEDIVADLKENIDRRVPFAVAGGGALQRIETRTYIGDPERPNGIGVYINLALRDGPEPGSLLTEPRGDVALAQNLLEPDKTMAFAFPSETYGRLSDDLKFGMAVERPDAPGEYHFPLMDGDDQIGIIKGISVEPESVAGGAFTNVLAIDIHGEYEIDNFFDPDFHLRIRLVPTTAANGLFDFDVQDDLDLSAAAYIVSILLGVVVSFVLPQLGIPLVFLLPLLLKLGEHVAEGMAGSVVQDELERTSFLDTLPHKLIVEARRWDPLYTTLHRVETADVEVSTNGDGFAFDAEALFVGRGTRPLQSMVIRSETRGQDGAVDGLVYRAADIGPFLTTDLVDVFAATDRMPHVSLLPPESDIERRRVVLTMQQVLDRIDAGDRHVGDLDYLPQKADIREHQIFQLLAVTPREIDEIRAFSRDRLRAEVRAESGAVLREAAIDQLRFELGREPTQEEIEARLRELIELVVEPLLPGRFLTELDRRLTFDLAPNEFAGLQRQKILVLGRGDLEIRTTPRGTVYYRDYERPFQPDVSKADNLLSLPR
ncbi:MAG TPA: hypothetical protein VHM94_11510, partial [Acidimicrobiia bacterium]|nr:hypothetical protein [Acidimicrobiia bacterium]